MANYDVLKERSKSCPKVLIRGESYVFDVDRVINFLVNKLGMERDAAIDVVADVMDAISQTGSEEISGEYIKGLLEGKALPVLKKDIDYYFNPAAKSLLEERYFQPGENWPALCRRVASFFADNPTDEEWYYSKLIKCDVLLNSPALMNAGTRLGYLSACNFLEVQDNMEDILEDAKRAGMISKYGGGVGFNFSKLRPTNDKVGENGKSSGTISFMEIFDKIGEVVRQGGCIDVSSYIPTDRGIEHAWDLLVNSKFKDGPIDRSIMTRYGLSSARISVYNGPADVVRIHTEHGYNIAATHGHKILVVNEDGTLVWRAIEEIKVGDWIPISIDPLETGRLQRLNPLPKEHHFNCKVPSNLPDYLDAELAYLVGLFVGDGCLSTQGRFHLSISSDDVYNRVTSYLTRLGLNWRDITKDDDNYKQVVIRNILFHDWWIDNGFNKSGAHGARVPDKIMLSPIDVRRAFLAGLFDADGTVKLDGYPVLSSVSLELVRGVQELLRSVGIFSRVYTVVGNGFGGNTIKYGLTVSHANSLRRFANNIELCDSKKRERLRNIEKPYKLYEPIPYSHQLLKKYLPKTDKTHGKPQKLRKLRHYTTDAIRLGKDYYYDRLVEIANVLGMEDMLKEDLLNPNLAFTRVIRKTEEKIETMDLEIFGEPEFIANGFIVHNRRRSAHLGLLYYKHPDVLRWLHAKDKKDKLTTFNISIAIDDEFFRLYNNGEDIIFINPRTNAPYPAYDPLLDMERDSIPAREFLQRLAKSMWQDGEPGVIYWDNLQAGNTTPWLGPIQGVNPCVTGDTLIALADGRGFRTIKELADEGKDVLVYVYDGERIRVSMGRNPRKTRSNVDVYKVILDDGSSFKATDDHKIMLRDGTYRMVRDLKPGDSLMPAGDYSVIVDSVKYAGKDDVYNITVDDCHNYIIVTHVTDINSWSGFVSANCGETPLYHGESCILGSVNLYHHLRQEGHIYVIDWTKLSDSVRALVNMLNACLDKNKYPFDFMREAALRTRKIGLGVMGFADMLGLLGIRYGSEESLEIAERVMSFINNVAWDESVRLADQYGPYPAYKNVPGAKWARNATVTCIAPTGSISYLAGVSSGIEPFYKIAYMGNRKEKDKSMVIIARSFLLMLQRYGMEDVIDLILSDGYTPRQLVEMGKLPEEFSHFVTAGEVTPEEHVKMQAVFQKYTSLSISKTINLPNKATVDEVLDVILLAHDLGCKGLTVFREGCLREAFLTEVKCPSCGSTNVKKSEGCITCLDCGASLCTVA